MQSTLKPSEKVQHDINTTNTIATNTIATVVINSLLKIMVTMRSENGTVGKNLSRV